MDQARTSTPVPPLNDVEERAWLGVTALVALGLPQVERTIREHGLVYIEYLLLSDLAAAPEGKRMSELAGCVQASPSRLSHRMRKLVDLGHVEQRPDAADGRGILAVITPQGRRTVERITPGHVRDLRRLVFAPLAPDQVEALADAMSAITAHLKQMARADGG